MSLVRKMEIILTVALIIVLVHLVLGMMLWLQVVDLYSYPGLLGFPIVGNLFYFYKTLFLASGDSTEKYMTSIAEKYGKNGLCFHWIYGFKKVVLVTSPHLVKELAFHPNLADKPECMYRGFSVYSRGAFTRFRSDDVWRSRRRNYNICLKRSRVNRDYYSTFIKHADKLIDFMLASPSAVDAFLISSGVTQSSALETMLGIETSLLYHPGIAKMVKRMAHIESFIMGSPTLSELILTALRPIDTIFGGKFNELRKLIMDEIELVLHQRPNPDEEQSLLVHIVSKTDKCNEIKTLLTEVQEAFFVATDTITSAVSNAIIFFALLPDLQERAWKEQHEIFGNDSRDPTVDDLEHMQFLDRFIKEALRFLSPPFVGKFATGDIHIDGITIPSGTSVIYLMRYMRMDPKYWKNPEVFDPDRFIEENDTLKHSYTPFGIGIRNCPAMYYATLQMKIILSKILRRLKLRPIDRDFRFENIQYKCCITIGVVNPPLLEIEERT